MTSEQQQHNIDIYPVGLFADWRRHRLSQGVRYVRYQAERRNWRAVRNYFNGFLAECYGHHHNAGRGWTRAAALRRVRAICAICALTPTASSADGGEG